MIRQATLNDIDSNLLTLYIEGYNLHQTNQPDQFAAKTDAELRDSLVKMLNSSNEVVLVTEEDGIIAYAALQIKQKAVKVAWIDEIIVDPSHRQKGHATRLLAEVRKLAADQGCQKIELICWSFNTAALKLYEKLGFSTQRVVLETNI